MDKVVVLASGGINSTVAAALAREQDEPALLHIAWGHRAAERERSAFEQSAAALRIEKIVVAELPCIAAFGGNPRVSKRIPLEDATALGTETPNTFVLGLLPTMLGVAATYAGAVKARRIILGISEDHGVPGPPVSRLYPDYRNDFLQTYNLMLHYAKPTGRELVVEAPLIEMNRAEVLRLGQQLDVPFDKTWSCYVRNDTPCGRCWGCAARTAGFVQCALPDPLLLQPAQA